MCKYDEAFTEKEMLEETGFCKCCKLDCPNAGKSNTDQKETIMDVKYHLNCYCCGYFWWSEDPFPDCCPRCKAKR